ncbi:protein of unknown function [Streptomyces murinus]
MRDLDHFGVVCDRNGRSRHGRAGPSSHCGSRFEDLDAALPGHCWHSCPYGDAQSGHGGQSRDKSGKMIRLPWLDKNKEGRENECRRAGDHENDTSGTHRSSIECLAPVRGRTVEQGRFSKASGL